jgi:hypothetical protein
VQLDNRLIQLQDTESTLALLLIAVAATVRSTRNFSVDKLIRKITETLVGGQNRMPKLFLLTAGVTWLGLSSPALAATIDIVAAVDAGVLVGFAVDEPAPANVTQHGVMVSEWRSVYEFALPILSETILSATFVASVTATTAPAVMSVFGYAGNGVIDLADANQVTTLIGATTLTAQPGPGTFLPITVALSPSFVEALGIGYLGLVTAVSFESLPGCGSIRCADYVEVASLENQSGFPLPTLRLETQGGTLPTAVPESGTLLLLGSGVIASALRARKRRLQTMRFLNSASGVPPSR